MDLLININMMTGKMFFAVGIIFQENDLGKIHFTPLMFQGFFKLDPKVSKLTVYPPEVSKNGNLNFPLKFSVTIDGN
jgi:hypothetical protein